MAMLEKWTDKHVKPIPVTRGRLEAVGKASLTLAWPTSNLYRFRVDGEHYFFDPRDLFLLDTDEQRIRQLHCDEEIVIAYRQTPTGRRYVTWATQPAITLVHEQTPLMELRFALKSIALAVFLFAVTACAFVISGLDNVPTAVDVAATLLGVLCALSSMVSAGLGSFALWNLHKMDRFSHHAAYRRHLADTSRKESTP